MITFVLCTGVGGDLGELLMKGMRRGDSKAVASLNKREVSRTEVDELKKQRKVANDFMRGFCKELVANADKVLFEPDEGKKGDEKARVQKTRTAMAIKTLFTKRLERDQYFGGGVKLADLVDFKMWLLEADRLGIELDGRFVQSLVESELMLQFTQYKGDDFRKVMNEVSGNNNRVNEAYVFDALRNEFRAQMAQLAVITSQPEKYGEEFFHHDVRLHGTRAPITPMQMWDFFKEKRTEFSLALVPVEVEKFVDKIEAPKKEEVLQAFFNEHSKNPYDPTSPKPGFRIPAKVKVSWITADPSKPQYQDPARVRTLLEVFPQYNPLLSPLMNAVNFAAAPHAEMELYRAAYFHDIINRDMFALRDEFIGVPLSSNGYLDAFAVSQGFESPVACASLVGALAQPDGIFAAVESFKNVSYYQNAKKFDYDSLAVREARKRAPIYAACAALSLQSPLSIAGTWVTLSKNPEPVPIELFLPKYREQHEKMLAMESARKFMTKLRKEFESAGQGQENNIVINRVLADTYKKKPEETKEFYDRFSIENAKELEPLRKAYLDSYYLVNQVDDRPKGTERHLTQNDFHKLFFDKSEPLSTAAGKYQVRPWPPVLTVKPARAQINPGDIRDIPNVAIDAVQQVNKLRLQAANPAVPVPWDGFIVAKQPFLFWISDETKEEVPEKLADVRGKVLTAWKIEQARDTFALPLAKQVARALQVGTKGDPNKLTQELVKMLGRGPDDRTVILLNKVAPLAMTSADDRGGPIMYSTYALPRDTILYPRPDTVQHIVSFPNLNGPIKIGSAKLDEINKELFEAYKAGIKNKTGQHLVQILTNKPQTAFYAAVLESLPEPKREEFVRSYRTPQDTFAQECFEYYAGNAYKVLRQSLRERWGWDVTEENAKNFDDKAGGG